MAINVMSWAWRESRADGAELLVLLAIADQAHEDGDGAWPSIATLAGKARVSGRTVQRCLRRLVELGELEIRAGAGRHGVHVYRVIMECQPVTPADSHPDIVTPVSLSPRPDDGATSSAQGVTSSASRGDTHVTRTKNEPSIEPSGEASAKAAAPPGELVPIRQDVERVCQLLADRIEVNGSKRPRITAKWRTAARLLIDVDGRTEGQITTAINWCQQDDFWRANVLSMPTLREKYDRMRLDAQRVSAKPGSQKETDDRFARAAVRMGVTK